MADIFVSYKKENRAHAERFAARLRDHGFSVWWDDNLSPREHWDAIIEREIALATSVVVLWTPLAVGSDWVNIEAHFGHRHGKLAPVMVEKCELPLAFSLTQTIDLCAWDGRDADRQWQKLLTWVADMKASGIEPTGGRARANRHRQAVGTFASGEPIVDGAVVSRATPAGTLFQDHPDGPVMRIVPVGDFLIGSAASDAERTSVEGPQKRVSLSRPFAIGVLPVTNAQLHRYAPATSSAAVPAPLRPSSSGWFRPKAPASATPTRSATRPEAAANHVSFDEAEAFAARLSEATAARYRLPSEAEWEYACRAGSSSRYSWGDEIDPSRALYRWPGATHTEPSPPGSFAANPFGLYDMHGNVREWTLDSWHETYDLMPVDGLAAPQGQSAMRVTRGGGWSDPPVMLRSSARSRATQTIRSSVIGLRLVRLIY